MGVHGLWLLLNPCGKPVLDKSKLAGHRVAIDISVWFHQAIMGMRDATGAPLPHAHLHVVFRRLCQLIHWGIKPVFVFDGGVPALKRQTLANRRLSKDKSTKEAEKSRKAYLKALVKHLHLSKSLNQAAALSMSVASDTDDAFRLSGELSQEVVQALEELTDQEVDEDDSGEEAGSPDGPNDSEDAPGVVKDFQRVSGGPTSSASSSPVKSGSPNRRRRDPRVSCDFFNIHDIDVRSEKFKELPLEVQHELITELAETRKQSSWQVMDGMPRKSGSFSDYQVDRLLQRRAFQVSKEEVELAIGEETRKSDRDDMWPTLEGGVIEDRRVTSDETLRVIVKDLKRISSHMPPQVSNNLSATAVELSKSVGEKKESGILVTYSEKQELLEREVIALRSQPSAILEESILLQKRKHKAKFLPLCGEVNLSEDEESSDEEQERLTPQQAHSSKMTVTDTNENISVPFCSTSDDVQNAGVALNTNSLSNTKSNRSASDITTNMSLPLFVSKTVASNEEDIFADVFTEAGAVLGIEGILSSQKRLSDASFVVEPVRPATPEEIEEPHLQGLEGGGDAGNGLQDEEKSRSPDEHGDGFSIVCGEKHGAILSVEHGEGKNLLSAASDNVHPVHVVSEDVLRTEAAENGNRFAVKYDERHPSVDQKRREPTPVSEFEENESVLNLIEASLAKLHGEDQPLLSNTSSQRASEMREPEVSPETVRDHLTLEEAPSNNVETLNSEARELSEEEILRLHAENVEVVNELTALARKEGQHERLAATMTEKMYSDAQELLDLAGAPWMVAPMEAEAQCACLEKAGLVSGTITDDSDVLLFGSKRVYRFFFNKEKETLVYSADSIAATFGLTLDQLICIGILSGCDYTDGIKGVGATKALEILKCYPGFEGLKRFKSDHAASKLESKFQKLNIPEGFPSQGVRDAFLSPEVDSSPMDFAFSDPDFGKMRDFAKERMGMSDEKIEEHLGVAKKGWDDRKSLLARIGPQQLTLDAFLTTDPTATPMPGPCATRGRGGRRARGGSGAKRARGDKVENEMEENVEHERREKVHNGRGRRKKGDPIRNALADKLKKRRNFRESGSSRRQEAPFSEGEEVEDEGEEKGKDGAESVKRRGNTKEDLKLLMEERKRKAAAIWSAEKKKLASIRQRKRPRRSLAEEAATFVNLSEESSSDE